MSDLSALRVELPRMFADLEPVQHAAGMYAKQTALDAITRDLGADRRMSGKPVTLGAGYDVGNPVVLHLRPGGLWILASAGRRRSGVIAPKKRSESKALGGPGGPTARSRYGPSRGLRTLDDIDAKLAGPALDAAVLAGVTDTLRMGGWV